MHIIFDLSEVFISGLIGAEQEIARDLHIPEKEIATGLNQPEFRALMRGEISEDDYFNVILARTGWNISIDRLKEIVRNKFHKEIPGTAGIAQRLSKQYPLTLLSDHAREWIAYIEKIHDFFDIFEQRLYSFILGKTKEEASLFKDVLSLLSVNGDRCIFIDDHQSNLDNAAKYGIEGILFTNAESLNHDLTAKGIL
jgi:putative hydrolase of the HAD superfamily